MRDDALNINIIRAQYHASEASHALAAANWSPEARETLVRNALSSLREALRILSAPTLIEAGRLPIEEQLDQLAAELVAA